MGDNSGRHDRKDNKQLVTGSPQQLPGPEPVADKGPKKMGLRYRQILGRNL